MFIHVDAVPADIDKDYRPQLELTGDIAATIEELATRLEGRELPANSALLAEIVRDRELFAQRAAALNGAPMHPMRLVKELQALLSDDMTLCLDMGSFHIWLARYLYSFRARQILMTNGQQTLGVGLPWAIAACLGSLSEMEYALDTLKMDGVSTLTSVEDIYLGDSRFDPWFEEMNRRKVTLFMHPTVARASLAVDLKIDISMLEFMFDTTRMLTNMVFTGAKRRFRTLE